MMFVPLQPFAVPLTAVPGVAVAPADGSSAAGSSPAAVGVTYALAAGDGLHAMAADAPAAPAVGWTGGLGPADSAHALVGGAARVVRALAPTTSPGRVTRVRGEARVTGVTLS